MTNFVNGGYWLSSTAPQLPPANIDATLYTHLFCGYAEIDPTQYNVTIPSTDVEQFSEKVRVSNPNVKTLLSIRGDSKVFSEMAKVPTARDVFINSSIEAAVAGGFNGLDLQWLYPSSPEDMKNFETLIGKWRQAAVKNATDYNRPEWILVATVPNLPFIEKNVGYPGEAIKQNLDWVNLVCYDFYTPSPSSSSGYTAPSSAFYNRKTNSLSACFGIDSWIGNLPPKKIVFGIPFQGWAWKLTNQHKHDVFAKASGPAASGEGYVIALDGRIDYSEVSNFIDATDAKNEKNDARYLIAYTFYETTWIAYESEYSISEKIKVTKAKNVLGYFGWNIAGDDNVNTLARAAKSSWNN